MNATFVRKRESRGECRGSSDCEKEFEGFHFDLWFVVALRLQIAWRIHRDVWSRMQIEALEQYNGTDSTIPQIIFVAWWGRSSYRVKSGGFSLFADSVWFSDTKRVPPRCTAA